MNRTGVEFVASDGRSFFLKTTDGVVLKAVHPGMISTTPFRLDDSKAFAIGESILASISSDGKTITVYDAGSAREIASLTDVRTDVVGELSDPIPLTDIAIVKHDSIVVISESFNLTVHFNPKLTESRAQFMPMLPIPFRFLTKLKGVRSNPTGEGFAVFNKQAVNVYQLTKNYKDVEMQQFATPGLQAALQGLATTDPAILIENPTVDLFTLPAVKAAIEEALSLYQEN